MKMRLKPFWSYYGSKYNIANKYPYPKNDVVIEPFAGSAQYSLLHYKKDVRLYDLDENICMVWDYLIHAKESQISRLTMDFNHIDELKGYTQEEKILMGFWCAKGASQPQSKMTSYAKHKKTANYKQRCVDQVKYIRHWKIKKASYRDVENIEATWFIDPPYQKGGHKYRKSSKQIDYHQLAHWCRERIGMYIVCEGNDATWLPFEKLAMQRSCNRGSCDNTELIYTNSVNPQLSLFEFEDV